MPLQLNLSDDQVLALTLAIDGYYSELREEIYHTDNSEVRQTLKEIEQALNGVRCRAGTRLAAGAGLSRRRRSQSDCARRAVGLRRAPRRGRARLRSAPRIPARRGRHSRRAARHTPA